MAEQRYQAVLAVISDGETVTAVAARVGVSRKTVHQWLARYEAGELEGLGDRSHRPQVVSASDGAEVEVALVDVRVAHPTWGPRRLVFELARAGMEPVPSESAAYRALVRLNLIDPTGRLRRGRRWKRWERGSPMELWQMDTVGGFVLPHGRRASAAGVVCMDWQQVCLGIAAAGHNIDVWVTDQVIQFYVGDKLLRTTTRNRHGQIRKKRASIPGGRNNHKTSDTNQPT